MFVHNKTGWKYYSIRDKIKYYGKRRFDKSLSPVQREYARIRHDEFVALDARTYETPELVVVDDAHFGNGASKPRLCVAYERRSNGTVRVAPIYKNNGKYVSFGSDGSRILSTYKNKYVPINELHESKHITNSDGSHIFLHEHERSQIHHLFQ